MSNSRIRALFVTPAKKAECVSMPEIEATLTGFRGDYHSERLTSRQILLVSGDLLDEFGLAAGALKENVTVDGLDVMTLAEGQRFRLGGALVEVTTPCEPCIQMDRVKHGLKNALKDRRGMFVRVIEPGTVRVGQAVVL